MRTKLMLQLGGCYCLERHECVGIGRVLSSLEAASKRRQVVVCLDTENAENPSEVLELRMVPYVQIHFQNSWDSTWLRNHQS